MKKELLDALKAKFVGVSDSILGRIADKLAKTASTEEDVANLVEGVTFQQVLESYGDSRATEAQQSAVTNYEKKHGLKDGKKVEQPEPQPKEEPKDDLASQIAAAVAAAMKPLNDKLAAMEGEKVANNRKGTLAKTLEKAPEKIRLRYEKDFERMNFADDNDFTAWIEEISPEIEAINNDFQAKGGVVTRPKGGSGGNATGADNPHLKARIQEKAAEVATPAIVGGLPNKTN